jgi:hypothetical protein
MMTKDIKISKRDGQLPVLKILNFFSPRSFSFTVFVEKERSINPFFKLLNSPGKNAGML